MPTEPQIRLLTSERPLDGSLGGVPSLLPRLDFSAQKFSTVDTPVQTLTTEDADLDLRHVQPTSRRT
jgi:hypothetical protein